MKVNHYEKVDNSRIFTKFFMGNKHRAILEIPFLERLKGPKLCVIGQNPSAACNQVADRTVRFLEKYLFEKKPEYSKMIMLNLYSCVDTTKKETSNINHPQCEIILREVISKHQNFLFVVVKLKNQRAYKFKERIQELSIYLIKMF